LFGDIFYANVLRLALYCIVDLKKNQGQTPCKRNLHK